MSEEEARKRQIEAARATREYAPVMAQEVRTVSEHTDLEAAKETIKTLIGRIDVLCATNAKLLVALKAILEHEHKNLASGGNYLMDADRMQAREAIKEARE